MERIKMTAVMIFLAIVMIGFYDYVATTIQNKKMAQSEEATLSIEGEIALTIIGLKDGNGVIAKGIYPCLKEGKKVRIYLKPSDTIKGSPTYEIHKIEGLP